MSTSRPGPVVDFLFLATVFTVSFAKRVGQIMTELPEGATPNPSYRFYM